MVYQFPLPTVHGRSFLPMHSMPTQRRHTLSDAADLLTAPVSNPAHPFQRSLSPLVSALTVLDPYPKLRAVLADLPPHLHYAFKASLLGFDGQGDPTHSRQLSILEGLFDGSPLAALAKSVDTLPLSCPLSHECVFWFIEGMLMDAWRYRRALGFLLTQLPLHHFPSPFRRTLASYTVPLALTVQPSFASWYLCSDAEPRLLQAIHDQAVLLVNGTLLLKFDGKFSAVALATTPLVDGTHLVAGCWYAPVDHREELRSAFDRGESRCCVAGQWTLLRELRECDQQAEVCSLFQQAQRCAATLPAQLPPQIGRRTRESYRSSLHENF